MSEEQKVHKEQTTRSIGYIESIDGIRGLFMLSVLLVHLHLIHFKIPAFLAQFSLHLFFVLSAFLISSILYKQKEKSKDFKLFAKDFYIKRALRILPLYWAYITFWGVIGFVLRKPTHDILGVMYDLKHYGWMLMTFTFNYRELFAWSQDLNHLRCHLFPHLWSISIEEQFYLIIPTVIFFLNKKTIKIISIVIILVYPLIRIFGFIYLQDVVQMKASFGEESNVLFNFFYRSSLFQFDAFFYGLLIPLVKIDRKQWLYILFIFFILILIASQTYSAFQYSVAHNETFINSIANPMILYKNGQFMSINTMYNLIGFCLVYIAVYYPNSSFNILYKITFFKKIGKIVYGFYIYHPVFALLTLALYYGFLVKVIPNILADIIAIAICTTATYYFAKLSYYKFEIYFLNLKSKK
ncbi:MAG: acyltransferase [Chitinophagales bacterium]